MSWDELGTKEYPCPCGKRTYSVTSMMDDWSRHDERWQMSCTSYSLFSYDYLESGIVRQTNCWVRTADLEMVSKKKEEAVALEKIIMKSAVQKHLSQWKDSFQSIKSKKQLWSRLKEVVDQPSLSVFYSHIKNLEAATYLESQFTFRSLSNILKR